MSGKRAMQCSQTLIMLEVTGAGAPKVEMKQGTRRRGTLGNGQLVAWSRARVVQGSPSRGGDLVRLGISSK
jgi:hypothetical protein